MLRQFSYTVCAAVVGFASTWGAVSVAPAGERCGACNGGPANIKSAPPTCIRIRWVAVYKDGRVRLVPRAYRVQVSVPATPSAPADTTPASAAPLPTPPAPEAPTSKDLPSSTPVAPGPSSPSPALSAPSPSGPAASDPAISDRAVLANRAQALLKAKCVRCHGENRQESGLDLRSRESILKGGESGPALIPGQSDESLVFKRVRAGEMPPRNAGRLLPEEIATLQQWIAAGAPSERAPQP
jgi:mono/diheme cytochrome c family protein